MQDKIRIMESLVDREINRENKMTEVNEFKKLNKLGNIEETYYISKLLKQTKPKSPFEEVSKLILCLTGIEGENNHGREDRQISLIGSPALEWILAEGKISICGAKFKANIHIAQSIADLKIGDRLQMGTSIIDITSSGKKCYSDICSAYEEDRRCPMQDEIKFARVIQAGEIKL